MKMVRSKTVELFYRKDGEPVEVYPRFCLDDGMINAPGAPSLSNGLTLAEQMRRKPDSTVCFWRTYALGDLLLLTPVFNWLRDEFPACRIILATASGFMPLFKYWDMVEIVNGRRILNYGYDIGYYLDGIVEQDHSGGPSSYKHRLDLYCEFLGIPVPKDPVFSLPYDEDEKRWADGLVGAFRQPGKPVVVIQISGSTRIKRLSLGRVMKIAGGLVDTCSLIFIHDMRQGVGLAGTMDLTGKTTVHEVAALIDAADVAVTMDSGLLWIAHCTMTPVIVLLGPTREQERLRYHRNYHVVNLSKMVGCEPCFERMTRCNGAVKCMNDSSEEEIIEGIRNGIRKLTYS